MELIVGRVRRGEDASEIEFVCRDVTQDVAPLILRFPVYHPHNRPGQMGEVQKERYCQDWATETFATILRHLPNPNVNRYEAVEEYDVLRRRAPPPRPVRIRGRATAPMAAPVGVENGGPDDAGNIPLRIFDPAFQILNLGQGAQPGAQIQYVGANYVEDARVWQRGNGGGNPD